jgi:maltose/moltooligosaccharide transporter
VTPFIALQSDRHRGPLGRRRPFLLWFTPVVVASLILLGTAKPIAHGLVRLLPAQGFPDENDMTILLLGIFAAGFIVANAYIINCYQYLFKDVIPQEVLGRFVGFYRAIGALAGFAFNRYLLGYAREHTAAIYTGCGLLYAVAFLLLVWKVKEGTYPPPEARPHRLHPWAGAKRYLRECFGSSFYLKIYSQGLCFWASWVPLMTFIVFFGTVAGKPGYAETLGLSLGRFGEIKGWTMLLQIPVYFLAGWLTDRYHPLRVLIFANLVTGLTYLGCFFFVAGGTSLLVWWVLNSVGCALFLAGYLALLPRLLPADRYGQFHSANTLVFQGGLIVAPLLAGWLISMIRDYRYIFLWSGLVMLAGVAPGISLYRHWQRLGGDKNYVPPGEKPAIQT